MQLVFHGLERDESSTWGAKGVSPCAEVSDTGPRGWAKRVLDGPVLDGTGKSTKPESMRARRGLSARLVAPIGVLVAMAAGGCSSVTAPEGQGGSSSSTGTGTTRTGTGTGDGGSGGAARVVADFSLRDVNPTSDTYDGAVSPRDYLEQVSGWFFGAAT